MKKIFNTLTAVALALCATATLASCGDDDDNDGPTTDQNPAKIGVQVDIELEGQALEIFDYNATLTLPNGQVKTLAVQGPSSVMQEFVNAADVTFPAEFTAVIERTPKAGYTPAAGTKVSWEEDFDLEVTLYNKDMQQIAERDYGFEKKQTNVDIKALFDAGKAASTRTLSLTVEKTADGYTIK